MYSIVDTNVLIVANGRDCPQASPECVLACVRRLRDIEQHGTLVLDDGWHIIGEYKHKVSQTGQPGLGDAFLKWVLTNQSNPQRIEKVSITPIEDEGFAEFPNTPGLEKFDRSDRKFVAVALTHPQKPPICDAVDSDWRNFHEALVQAGVTVEFLCPDLGQI
jgi:hypothetical protein